MAVNITILADKLYVDYKKTVFTKLDLSCSKFNF